MTHILAQTYSTVNGADLILPLLFLAIVVVWFVGMWKMFEKADRPGWAALVPLYNSWVMAEMVGWPGWYGLYPLLGIIPFLGPFAVLGGYIALMIKLAGAFGEKDMAVLLILLPPIGTAILGFGDATYDHSAAYDHDAYHYNFHYDDDHYGDDGSETVSQMSRAEVLLDERYAKGEIDHEDYLQRKANLG